MNGLVLDGLLVQSNQSVPDGSFTDGRSTLGCMVMKMCICDGMYVVFVNGYGCIQTRSWLDGQICRLEMRK